MTDQDKAIWQASRGDKDQFIELLTELFAQAEARHAEWRALAHTVANLHDRIDALEAKRGPGRPKGS